MDYGFHPPTIYFPLIVPEALMIEPTETETKETLDAFCDAMLAIAREAAEEPGAAEGGAAQPPGAAARRGAGREAADREVRVRGASGRQRRAGAGRGRGAEGRLARGSRVEARADRARARPYGRRLVRPRRKPSARYHWEAEARRTISSSRARRSWSSRARSGSCMQWDFVHCPPEHEARDRRGGEAARVS